MNDKLVFGQRVRFKAIVKKMYQDHRCRRRIWQRYERSGTGLYIGYRTVQEGEVHGGAAFDDPMYFVPQKHLRVLIVVENERHNPVRVLPDDVEIGVSV